MAEATLRLAEPVSETIAEIAVRDGRFSNLIHEQAFHSLSTLQEFEHETFETLNRRLAGVHAAALYTGEQSVYQTLTRPKA